MRMLASPVPRSLSAVNVNTAVLPKMPIRSIFDSGSITISQRLSWMSRAKFR